MWDMGKGPANIIHNGSESIAVDDAKQQLEETNELFRNSLKLQKLCVQEMAEYIKGLNSPEGEALLKKLEVDL